MSPIRRSVFRLATDNLLQAQSVGRVGGALLPYACLGPKGAVPGRAFRLLDQRSLIETDIRLRMGIPKGGIVNRVRVERGRFGDISKIRKLPLSARELFDLNMQEKQ